MSTNERVTLVREKTKLSMRKFAEQLGVSVSTISLIEKGERELQIPLAKAISKEFGIREEWLIHGEEPMSPPEEDRDAMIAAKMVGSESSTIELIKEGLDIYFGMSEEERKVIDKVFSEFKKRMQ